MNGLSPLEVVWTVNIALFWSLAYVFISIRGFKDRSLGMPWLVLGVNLGWEFIFAFIHPSPGPQMYINAVWFLLDLPILLLAILYGAREPDSFVPKKLFHPLLALVVLLSLGLFNAMGDRYQGKAAIYGGFVVNIFISALFIVMLIRRGSARGQSLYVAVSKMLGTLFSFCWFATWPWVLPLYIPIFALDMAYTVALYRRLRADGISPWRHV